MIKNYLQLSEIEKYNAYEFITRNQSNKISIQQVDAQLKDDLYELGKGCLFLFNKEILIATIRIILKEVHTIGTAYIVALDILDEIDNKVSIIRKMINEASHTALRFNAKEIYFSTRDLNIVNLFKQDNILHSYSAITMKLIDNNIRYNELSLIQLSYENKLEYKQIHDDIFLNIPNGGSVSLNELDDKINNKDNNNFQYIVMDDDINIGMLEICIYDNIGSFDLGLLKEYRNRGYGKRLLETAIIFLRNIEKVDEINLLVISKNTLVYNMYLKRGFVDKEIYSYWYDAKDFI